MKPYTSQPIRMFGVAVVLALTACSGGADKATQPVEPVADPVPTPEPTPVADKEPLPEPPPVEKKPAANPEVHAYTASEQGFLVSSYAIVDNGEVMLVDSQMIKPEAEKFIEMVKGLGAPVKTIFITHAHPDHYLGLEWVTAAFPDAKVVATKATAELIAHHGEETLKFTKSKKYLGGVLKPILPAKVIVPTALEGESVTVGLAKFEVFTYPGAESEAANVLFEPTTGAFLAGDLIYNNVHLWLKDQKPEAWIAAINDLKDREQIKQVYPGHGEPGGRELFTADLDYLTKFDAAVKASTKQKDLISKVKADFPAYRLPAILTFAAPTYFKK